VDYVVREMEIKVN